MFSESNSSQLGIGDKDVKDGAVALTKGSVGDTSAASRTAPSKPIDPMAEVTTTTIAEYEGSDTAAPGPEISIPRTPDPREGTRWWLLAAAAAVLLTAMTVAAVYLVTKKPSTVDQLVILTVPSGAEIKLDSKDYGHSPVKLERLAIGTYTVTISKEGFETIVEPLTVSDSAPVEYKLTPVPPSEVAGLPVEEAIKQYQQRAEEAFARGDYGLVYEGSARRYADLIFNHDPNNSFALEMRERIRKAAHQSAESSISRGDLAQAQEIYSFLMDYYPHDEEAHAAAAKLENQLSARRGEMRELLRKADEALQAGRLTEPVRSSAYFYSKQALAIDRQNDKARQIRNQVKDRLAAAGEQAYARGELETGIKELEQVAQLFPEDKQVRARVRELQSNRVAEVAKPDANSRRLRGLDLYVKENFNEAIHDLEFALINGRGTPEVVFALARSYMKIGELNQAESYFLKVPHSPADPYHSSIAALGDIAYQRGDTATAVERWKEARQLGGSTLYAAALLEDKIERIEKRQREKAAEPTPLTLPVKHVHGGLLGGSCNGTLTINSTGVRFDGEHVYASSLIGVRIGISKDEMSIRFEGNSQKFRVPRADAERCRETLSRYQQTYSPANK